MNGAVIIMSGIIQNLIKAVVYPVWKEHKKDKKTFLTFSQIKPVLRVFLDFVESPPNMDTSEWVEFISVMTVVLLYEKDVLKALSNDHVKELHFLTAKVAKDTAIRCMYEPDVSDDVDENHVSERRQTAKRAMLCSFLNLHKLSTMACSPQEWHLHYAHLRCLVTHVQAPCGFGLIHVLSDLQNICDVPSRWVHTSLQCPESGKIDVVRRSGGKIFPYIPSRNYLEFAIKVGGGSYEKLTKHYESALDIFFFWIRHNPRHKFFSTHMKKLKDFVEYMWDSGTSCNNNPSDYDDMWE
jgi:hypothetical protein